MTTERVFYKTDKALWKAKGFFSPKTGEAVSISILDKTVYMHIENRITFFVDVKKGKYFETHDTIAESLGLEKKAVGKSTKKWRDAGVFHGKSKRAASGNLQWAYSGVVRDLNFWNGEEDNPVPISPEMYDPDKEDSAPKTQPTSPRYVYVPNPEDEEGSPF